MSDRRYGVLIGNSHFPNEDKLQDLRCPTHDVDGLNEILLSQLHGGFTETFVLKDRPHYEVLLKINQVLKQRDKSDLVFIYYSGHGKLDLANRLHLCTADTMIDVLEATSVPVQSIKNFIDVSPSTQVALVLDCCFSGAVGSVFARSGVDDQLQLMSGGRGTYVMSASTGIQVALEKEGDENSVFTAQVIEGIRSGAADVNGDGIVTMDELYKYVHDRVLAEGFQEPEKWGINVRGELVIARTSKTPRADRRRQIRDVLLDLASQNILPDRILTKAMEIIALQPQQLSSDLEAGDRLLDRLVQKEIGVGEFIDEWYKLSLPRVSASTRQQAVSSEGVATKPRPQPEPKRPRPDVPRAPKPADPSKMATAEGAARTTALKPSPGWPTTGYLFLTAIYWTIAGAIGVGVWGEVSSSEEMSSMAFVGAVAAAIYGASTGLVFRWARGAAEWRGVLSLGSVWGVAGAVAWAAAEGSADEGGPVVAALVAAIVGATWGGVMIWRLLKARGQEQPATRTSTEVAGPPPSIRRAAAYGVLAGLSLYALSPVVDGARGGVIASVLMILAATGMFAGLEIWLAHRRGGGAQSRLSGRLGRVVVGSAAGVAAGAIVLSVTRAFPYLAGTLLLAVAWCWFAFVAISGVAGVMRINQKQRYSKLFAAIGAGLVAGILWRTLAAPVGWELGLLGLVRSEVEYYLMSYFVLTPLSLVVGPVIGFWIGLREVLRPPYGAHTGEGAG